MSESHGSRRRLREGRKVVVVMVGRASSSSTLKEIYDRRLC